MYLYLCILQGGIDDSGVVFVRVIMYWQYRIMYRGYNLILNNFYKIVGLKVNDYIFFYGFRVYGKFFEDGFVVISQVIN